MLSYCFQGLQNLRKILIYTLKFYFRRAIVHYERHWFKKMRIKLWCLYLVQHVLHQIQAPQFYSDSGLQKHC